MWSENEEAPQHFGEYYNYTDHGSYLRPTEGLGVVLVASDSQANASRATHAIAAGVIAEVGTLAGHRGYETCPHVCW